MITDQLPTTLYAATRFLFQKTVGFGSEEQELIISALYAAGEFHSTQRRKSGQLFIIHPVHVAAVAAHCGGDAPTIAASLLHDVLEDTDTKHEEITKRFGKEVYSLVEAVTHQPMFSTKEFLEKVYAKSRTDPRVAIIKISDRCVNLIDQEVFSKEAHLEHLQETDDFYINTLATIPDLPKELTKTLKAITQKSWELYHSRTI
jgi:(p)ppGpp synthase/HD superfamily hydrolase